MVLFVAGFAAILYLALTAEPTSTVVLLPDADGRAGAVDVRAANERKSLTTAYTSASTTGLGAIVATAESPEQLRQRYEATLSARPAAPVSFTLLFEFGSATEIAPQFRPVLAQLLAVLADYPAPEITVIGHTDRVGSDQDNDRLALQRAATVRDWLLQSGIAPEMVSIAGRGEREPAVPTADNVPLAENRRVEINLR